MTRHWIKLNSIFYGLFAAMALLLITCFAVVTQALSSESTDCKLNDNGIYQIDYLEGQRSDPDTADEILSAHFECLRKLEEEYSGRSDSLQRITDGSPADSNNFLEVVRIKFDHHGSRDLCTGVIIASDTILTAAHCSCGRNYQIEIQYTPATKTDAAKFLKISTNGPLIRFPGYLCRYPPGVQVGRDLALIPILKLKLGENNVELPFENGPVPRSFDLPVIRPAIKVLADRELRSLYIVGFGRIETGIEAENMMATYVGVLSRFCADGRIYFSICAMYREFSLSKGALSRDGKSPDSCGGDSGGPAYRIDSEAKIINIVNGALNVSQKTLVGIVSRAIRGVRHPYPGFCGGGGIYTSVGTKPVIEWLQQNGVEFKFNENGHYTN